MHIIAASRQNPSFQFLSLAFHCIVAGRIWPLRSGGTFGHNLCYPQIFSPLGADVILHSTIEAPLIQARFWCYQATPPLVVFKFPRTTSSFSYNTPPDRVPAIHLNPLKVYTSPWVQTHLEITPIWEARHQKAPHISPPHARPPPHHSSTLSTLGKIPTNCNL